LPAHIQTDTGAAFAIRRGAADRTGVAPEDAVDAGRGGDDKWSLGETSLGQTSGEDL